MNDFEGLLTAIECEVIFAYALADWVTIGMGLYPLPNRETYFLGDGL